MFSHFRQTESDGTSKKRDDFRERVLARMAKHLGVSTAQAAEMMEQRESIDATGLDPANLKQASSIFAIALYRRLADLLRLCGSGYTVMLGERVEALYLDLRSKFLDCLKESSLKDVFDSLDDGGLPPSLLELGPLELSVSMEDIIEPAILRNQARLLREAHQQQVDPIDPVAEAFMSGYDEVIAHLRNQKCQYEERLFGTGTAKRSEAPGVDKPLADGAFEKQLRETLSKFHESSDEKLTGERLARAMYISRSTLNIRLRDAKLTMKDVRRLAGELQRQERQ